MAINIHAGKRVLYKNGNSGWLIGDIMEGKAEVNSTGVFIPIIPHGTNADEEYHWAEINNLFLDAEELNQNLKMYPEYYMSKEDYLNFIVSDDFHRSIENAYFTDGEYIYYPVSKYSKNWIEKQPFDYIVRSN